ncbi:MAG: ATP-binding protein [Cyanobacteria bacterium P01_F01_bin.53]
MTNGMPESRLTPDELLTEIYSAFEPFLPPPEGTYVDCSEVRGRWDVVRKLGNQITRSKVPTCQLYSGHRGVGKTAELLKLKTHLEGKHYKVVYFAAEEDIETQDAAYADILFACTKNLVQEIRLKGKNPLVEWMRDRWQLLNDLAATKIEFDSLSLEQKISQFSKITAKVRAVPDSRREPRKRLNDSTPSLIVALNSFIDEAKKQLIKDAQAQQLPESKGIVIIVDNLDRIAENNIDGLNNHDEIYLNRSELMRGLNCHLIYTAAPIQMIYSPRVTQLEDNYGKPDVLPLVMVRDISGGANAQGLSKFKELICRRLMRIDPQLPDYLDTYVFDSVATRQRLCFMSGGHMRVLMQLLQKSMDQIDELPITAEAAQIAIQEQRDTYRTGISKERWELFARAHLSKQIENDEDTLLLLLNRCLTEYRYYDEGMELKQWCDVHPLLEGFEQFKAALAELRDEQEK